MVFHINNSCRIWKVIRTDNARKQWSLQSFRTKQAEFTYILLIDTCYRLCPNLQQNSSEFCPPLNGILPNYTLSFNLSKHTSHAFLFVKYRTVSIGILTDSYTRQQALARFLCIQHCSQSSTERRINCTWGLPSPFQGRTQTGAPTHWLRGHLC